MTKRYTRFSVIDSGGREVMWTQVLHGSPDSRRFYRRAVEWLGESPDYTLRVETAWEE